MIIPRIVSLFQALLLLSLSATFASAASIEDAVSDGSKITLSLRVPGGDLSGVRLFRFKTSDGFWTRLKANLVRDENGNWTSQGPTPTNDPELFLREDHDVSIGEEYCYGSSTTGQIAFSQRVCAIHQPAGSQLDFPNAPENLNAVKLNIESIVLEFDDVSDNERQFIVERRFSNSSWNGIAILPAERLSGTRVRFGDRDLDAATRYCYRVTATNADGSRPSNVECVATSPAVVPSVDPPDDGSAYLSNISHHVTDGLAVSFVFSEADFDRTFFISIFRRSDLDGEPLRSVNVRIRQDWPRPSAGTFFDDLDPSEVYCAKIKTLEIDPDRFGRRILCESPFARRLSNDEVGPRLDELPVLVGVSPNIGGLALRFDRPIAHQFVDMVEASTGLRETRLERSNSENVVLLQSLRQRAVYCVRPVVTNTFGSRYGRFICTQTAGTSGGGGGGGMGGSGGGATQNDNLQPGVDCDCNATGPYVDATPVDGGIVSSDGMYRVERSNSSVSVFRVSNNERLFNATGLNSGFTSGFGPRSRFFVLAERQDLNRVAVSVHDLEASAGNQQAFLDTNVVGSSGFGFSPDGRTFMLARTIATGQLGISLVNLDDPNLTTGVLTFGRPFSGFFQFSPCGEAFATGLGPTPTGTPLISLFKTVDAKPLKTGLNLPSDFAGVAATLSDHTILRSTAASVIIAPNTAGQACVIPGTASDGYQLTTVRYPQVTLNNSDADTIMADASSILQSNDAPGDVECDVTFERSGSVFSSTFGDGSIDTSAELEAIFAEAGNAKAVDELNFCGELQPGLLGCAPTPGTTFVFVRGPEEASTFAHEFGHNKGLEHREDDNDALMFPSASPTANKVNAAECAAFLSQGSSPFSFVPPDVVIQPSGLLLAGELAGQNIVDLPIEDFVRRRFYEGVPYKLVQRYDQDSVPVLLDMLDDPAESQAWSNIVVTIGMLGDDRAVAPLIEFIERDLASMDRSQYRAKTSAIMALGYIINKSGNEDALSYLSESLSPETWSSRRVDGIAPYQSDVEERNRDFSKAAVLGLALAATPDARAALSSLKSLGRSPGDRQFRDTNAELIESAVRESREIQGLGLADYYRD